MSSHRHTNENNNTVINDKLHSAVETSSTCANERLDDKEDIRNRKHLNSTTTSRQNNPYEEASFFSRLFFLWPYGLLKKGMKQPLTEDDLPDISQEESSKYNLVWFEQIWKKSQQQQTAIPKKHPSLHRALIRDFLKSSWHVQIYMLIGAIARIGQAVVVGELIQYFSSHATSNTSSSKEGFIWAAILVLCGLVTVFEHHHVFFITWRKGLQLKVAMVAAIYAKATRLGAMGSSSSVSSGQVVNLAGNDADRFLMACLFGPYLWWGPAYTVGVLIAGIMIIGPSFLAGFSLLLIFVPLQFYLSYRFATLRSKVAHITDRRITLVSQAVGGARVMKMSGWETQFEERIEKIRQLESARIQKANRLRALNEAIYFTSSIIMNVVIFVVYVRIQGGTLTPRKVFSCMALINVVQFELMKHFALGVMGVSECSVSVSRIQDFLRSPEIVTPVLPAESTLISEKVQPIISLNGVTCHWKLAASSQTASDVDRNTFNEDSEASSSSDSETAIAISKVSLDLKRGELCCIIGSVGSGKSALILALAGELQCSKGEIIRNYTSLAYAAQDSWIMDGTVRENITFGLEFKEEWYNEVVNACGLLQDFSQFHNGDQTIVGDRGVQCSGGQRARIGLARALYRDADIVLLDDPLSAVDAKVGRLLFYSAIQELCVQRGKCVVLATHQHQFLGSSRCVYMSRGEIAFIGSYADCAAVSNGTITKSLQATSSDRYEDGSVLKSTIAEEDNDDDSPSIYNGSPSETVENVDEKELEDKNAHKEQKTTGLVSAKTYLNYMKAMGGVGPVLVNLLLFLAAQASILIAILAIGYWARMPFNQQTATSTIGVILGLGAIVALLAWIRSVSGFYFTIKASQRLHDNMLSSVLRAKIEFFDTNPVGRILNRFSGDIGIIDDALPQTLFDFFVCLFMVIGGIITAAVVMPYVLIAFPPVLYYFYSARVTFVTTSRELKRIEGVARSPIFAMLGEALQGIGTIRANQSIPFFCKKFENVQNDHTRAFWSFIAASRWLGFRLDLIVWLMLTLVSFLSVFATYGRWFEINPSLLGLALLLVIQLGALFQWCVRQSAEVVTQMVSVERVVDFSSLDSEAALITDEDKKHPSWPHQGNIEIDSLTVRYRSGLPPSLLGVNVLIETRQRVGVVGRTGSGKSTFVQSLFRLLEAESGKIVIDNVDISLLGLHKLRTQMSVIPQMPVLFNGCTIRENLDPFGIYDDEAIWSALADVQMVDAVKELPASLSTLVAEGGSNFSVGQRQLLCLARAILRKNRILVLDEPTANVDGHTDKLLQAAVSKSFTESTIIAVAHRLDTVIEYDKILVLGNGRVLEYGPPNELLKNEDGPFSSMVRDTGPEMSTELRRKAFSKS